MRRNTERTLFYKISLKECLEMDIEATSQAITGVLQQNVI